MSWADGKLVHFLAMPGSPSAASFDDALSLTEPSSVSLQFSGGSETVVRVSGVSSRRKIVPGGIMLCGPEPIEWLGGSGTGAGEFIEITASPELRREVAAELGVPQHGDLDNAHGWGDPLVTAIAARFRAAARRTTVLDDIERDLLLRRLYARVIETRFGGRARARGNGGLDPVRLNRVLEFVEANLGERLTVADLAAVAALSPFHFVRSFRRSSGLTPHAYVRARRLERARSLLAHGEPISEIALSVGFFDQSHLTRDFRRHLGLTPEAYRRTVVPKAARMSNTA